MTIKRKKKRKSFQKGWGALTASINTTRKAQMGYKIEGNRMLASVLQEVFTDKRRSLNIVPSSLSGHSKQITASHSDLLNKGLA